MERHPTYEEVHAKMCDQDWGYIDEVMRQFPIGVYTSTTSWFDTGTLLGVAVREQVVPAIRHLLKRGVSVNEDPGTKALPTIVLGLEGVTKDEGRAILDLLVSEGDFDPQATFEHRTVVVDSAHSVKGTLLHWLASRCGISPNPETLLPMLEWLVEHEVPLRALNTRNQTAYAVLLEKISRAVDIDPYIFARMEPITSLLNPTVMPKNANT